MREREISLPPELASLSPKINERFTVHKGRHAIIDTDAFCQQREIFDPEKIKSKMNALHEEISKSFKIIVTQHALNVWE